MKDYKLVAGTGRRPNMEQKSSTVTAKQQNDKIVTDKAKNELVKKGQKRKRVLHAISDRAGKIRKVEEVCGSEKIKVLRFLFSDLLNMIE